MPDLNTHAAPMRKQCGYVRNICRGMAFALCFTAFTATTSQTAFTAEPSQQELQGLAKNFLRSVNKGFTKADKELHRQGYSVSSIPADAPRTKTQPSTEIPDGEELLLRILVGNDKISLPLDVLAVKERNDIMISLSDFFYATDIPITVDSDNGTATGWFIREHQDFFLDANKEEITLIGETSRIDSTQIKLIDGELYASSYIMSQWFGMTFIVDFTELAILLKTTQPLPAEERHARRKKRLLQSSTDTRPQLPLKEEPYRKATVPSLDVNLQSSRNSFQGTNPTTRHTWSVIGTNDLAGHSMQSFVSGDNEDKINNARLTFDKKSKRPELLGPLNARSYSFGDIYTTRLPLTGNSAQEQGVRVSNLLNEQLPSLSTTNIRGDAQPGWDVELYRNDRLVSFQEITADGAYNFEEVSLFAGDNNFKIVFYGPQGEIREERKSIPVNNSQLKKGQHFYDVSLSRNNTITYRENEIGDPEDGAPHLIARYDRGLGRNSSIHAGLRHRQEENDTKTYLETGLTTNINNTLWNASLAMDATTGGAAVEVTGRRQVGQTSLRGNLRLNTSTYDPGNESADPLIVKSDFSARGPFKNVFGHRSTYGIDTKYIQRDSGAKDFDLSGSLSTRVGNTIINNSLIYDYQEDAAGNTKDVITGNINMRGFMQKARWRVVSNYEFIPKQELRELIASVTYPFSRRLEGFFEFEHELDPQRTEAVASLNWKTDSATITPRLSLDTDDTMQASVNVRFGVGYNPEEKDFSMYNKSLSRSGSATAHVFLDKDGDGIFSAEDQHLPDVSFEAVQAHRANTTNDKGTAFIPDLPADLATDLTLDSSTFEDPYWISSYRGLSVKPRAGVTTHVEFPLVVSGEIDGTVYAYVNKDSPKRVIRQLTLHLFSPSGKEVQRTLSAYDGFYIFSNVPPGTYYIVANSEFARTEKYTLPLPKRIDIRPDGTVHYGVDLTLRHGPVVDYLFTSTGTPYHRSAHAVTPPPDTQSAGVILGQYKSRLAMTLAWYKVRMKNRKILQYFELEQPLADIQPDAKTHMYMLRLSMKNTGDLNLETAHMACQVLSTMNFPCTIELKSHYKEKMAQNDTVGITSQ